MGRAMIKSRTVRRLLSLALALLLIGSVSYLGVKYYRPSSATTAGTLSLSPSSSALTSGSTLSVTINENSGTDPVNAVQASVTYDPGQLQYVSISEGGKFPVAAATSTDTPGIIRVGRGVQDQPVTGSNPVVTINFKVLATSGSASLGLDTAYSFIVRSTDNQNILQSVTGASYSVSSTSTSQPVSGPPVFTMSPASGNYAVGSNVAVAVRINSPNTPITTVQPVITYPADKLQYVGVTEGGTFTTIQRTKNVGNTVDVIRGISGGAAGVTGDKPVVTINFKVIAAGGSAGLNFTNVSAAFDNSGTGQNILNLAGSAGASYSLPTGQTASTPPQAPQNPGVPTSAPAPAKVVTAPSGSVAVRASSGASVSSANGATTIAGEVAFMPLIDTDVAQANPGDAISKVEYYLGNKLIATKQAPPFDFKLDTNNYRNGNYDLTVKTHYKSGTVDSNTDKLAVSNPVTLTYVFKHHLLTTLAALVMLGALAFVAWRYLIPHFGQSSSPAVSTASAGQPYIGGNGGGLYAPSPTVVTPAGVQPVPPQNIVPDVEAVQNTPPLPVAGPQPVTPQTQPGAGQVVTPSPDGQSQPPFDRRQY